MSTPPTVKNAPSLTARPYTFNRRTVIALPPALVDTFGIEEELTELEIRPDSGGFYVTVKRRGDFHD